MQGPVLGSQTGASIPAGYVGEVLSANDSVYQSTTSGAYNTLSLALTPGVWDVSGSCGWLRNGATISQSYWIASITNQNSNPSDWIINQTIGTTSFNELAWTALSRVTRVRWDGVTNITEGSTNTSSNLVYTRCYNSIFTGGPVLVIRTIRAVRIN